MKQMGLKAKIRAKKAYRHPAMGEISENLLKRRFKARKSNEKWLTDVIELKGSDGKLYLSPILDLFNHLPSSNLPHQGRQQTYDRRARVLHQSRT